MPGPLDGPLGPLPNMFWDPVRAKYFPNPRQSTAVPNQPRQERPNMRPPSPTRDSKTIMTHVKEVSLKEDPESSSAAADPASSTANTCRRRKLNPFRRLDGSGGMPRSALTASTHQNRMRGLVYKVVCSQCVLCLTARFEENHWINLGHQSTDDVGGVGHRIVTLIVSPE